MKQRVFAGSGDLNAFFGLMLDNVAVLLLLVGLLHEVFNFPATFALRYMVPGTALGVLFGDLVFTAMSWQLARRTGRDDVTAMPLGLDTPSTFGMVFFVLGPAYARAAAGGLAAEEAATHAWHVGICSLLYSGVFKLVCAGFANWVRAALPRAGLLGSLAAIALVLIAFLPLLDLFHYPPVGLLSLGVILVTLVARIALPGRLPGALAALIVGCAAYYGLRLTGRLTADPLPIDPAEGLLPGGWLTAFRGGWIAALGDAADYLPITIPFALATVVGGIDCTESAAAAGDDYPTGKVILVEAVATLIAGLAGGVIQTTPYIGHPAYKAMGGRSGYTLATALFIGSAGLLGYFGYFYWIVPKAAIFPILIFIGLEITAQSYHATPERHYPAVGIACLPAMAALVMVFVGKLAPNLQSLAETNPHLLSELWTLRLLSGGFIVTSLLWASGLAAIIDRRLSLAAGYFAVCAACSLFGVIHSPLDSGGLLLPWALPSDMPESALRQSPTVLGASYAGLSLLLLALAQVCPRAEPGPQHR